MNKALLLAGIVLAHVTLGDFNAGYYREGPQQRRPRYQRLRPRLSPAPVKEEPAQRRTFITALLAAEVAYLEGLLSDQATGGNKQPAHHQRGKAVQHAHAHKHNSVHHSAPYQAAATKPVKYVSKLDPFYMIAAPDLTKESPKTDSYDAPKENPASTPAYDAPAVTTTTAKYGELEHYNLGSYLPPPPAKPAPQYDEPAPAPAYAPPPNSYQIATTTTPPATTTKSYSAPTISYAPSYQQPAPAPAYENPAPAPAYHKPAPTYGQTASAPETKLVLVPSYPRPSPSYAPGPPSYSYNQHPHTFFHDAQVSKVHDKSDQVEAEIGDNVGSSSNAGPITGSNGDFPTIFYNNLGGSSKNTLIL